MGRRGVAGVSLVGIAALSTAAAVVTGPLIGVPPAAGVFAAVLSRLGWVRPVVAGGAASLVSLAATVVLPSYPPPPLHNVAGMCLLLEALALMTLMVGAVRRSSAMGAVLGGLLAGGGLTALPLRVAVDSAVPPTALEVVALCLLGSTAGFVAAAAGGYLRVLDRRRVRAVVQMRRAERVGFARDLHDFVGHDLTGIVLEAQAAQLVPERSMAALRRIENVGLSALTSMDHTVQLLHEQASRDMPVGGLAELDEVVRRFHTDGTVTLHVDPAVAEQTPREYGAIAYRVVVEALTNVRRHATGVTVIRVAVVAVAGPAFDLTVTDDGTAAPPSRRVRRGGFGLVGLRERIDAVGGTLTAGPVHPRGWRVHVVLPLPAGGSPA